MRRAKQIIAHIAGIRRSRLDGLVVRMYADYQTGLTLAEVAKKHGRDGKNAASAIWVLFRNRGLKMRKRHSSSSHARGGLKTRARLDTLVGRMYDDYRRPISLSAVGRKYRRTASAVAGLFECRGLALRHDSTNPNAEHNPATGCYLPLIPKTDREIDQMIAGMSRIQIPAALREEWRHWSLERRGQFIARLRKKLNLPGDRPATPFSANVEPFDYASPRAHEITKRMNAGRNSQTKAGTIRLCSQGVIWRGRLFFWAQEHAGGAYYIGPWRKDGGRPSLHHLIWEDHHGRPVPAGHVVRFKDGNRNNLDPANFTLATRNDVARENQAAALLKKSREDTALLLGNSQRKNPSNGHNITIKRLRRAS
jgi:hypothetical protein